MYMVKNNEFFSNSFLCSQVLNGEIELTASQWKSLLMLERFCFSDLCLESKGQPWTHRAPSGGKFSFQIYEVWAGGVKARRPLHKPRALVWSRAMHYSPHIYIRHNGPQRCQKCVRPSCVCTSSGQCVSASLGFFATWGFCRSANGCWRNMDEGKGPQTPRWIPESLAYNQREQGGRERPPDKEWYCFCAHLSF